MTHEGGSVSKDHEHLRGDDGRFHIVYKITCVVTGHWYIGKHSTHTLKDRYKGSGKKLKESRKKYGDGNHIFEIWGH